MASQPGDSSPALTAQFIADTFVKQYYKVLSYQPDLVHKFYQDKSMLSRPGPDGVMTSVTTMEGINEKILSSDYKGCRAEITTVDAQFSHMDGVVLLVTGCWIEKDSVKRSFTQTFFLAQQHATGYYVLNDVFRFVAVVKNVSECGQTAPLTSDQESAHVPRQASQSHTSPTKGTSNDEVCDSSEAKSLKSSIQEVVSESLTLSQNGGQKVADSTANVQEVPQKMSYASMVVKESTADSPYQLTTSNIVTVAPSSTHQDQCVSATPRSSAPRNKNLPQNTNKLTDVQGVFIGNLPSEVSVEELDATFKEFGPIKKDGIKIRICKDGFCYGFVDFEHSSSAQSAIETHNIMIGENEVYISEKRYSSNQASSGRGRSPGQGEPRYGNYKARENFVEGRTYAKDQYRTRGEVSGQTQEGRSQYRNRGEASDQNREGRYQYRNRGEFLGSGQSWESTGRNGEAQQRFYQNGGGRTANRSRDMK